MSTLGYLDSNVFIHVLFPHDAQYPRAAAVMAGLQDGSLTGRLDPLVIHELAYVLPRLGHLPDRSAVVRHLQGILSAPGVECDERDRLLVALNRWLLRGGSFVDAWLAILALTAGEPICSANHRDFPDVPNTF